MKLYELNYLILTDLSEKELKGCQEKISSLIQEEGGILIDKEKRLVRKTLAYPIKKRGTAFLATLSFQILPERLESLEKKLKSESNILRYQIFTKKLPKKIRVVPIGKPKNIIKPKVELKEIEKKLEEILNET